MNLFFYFRRLHLYHTICIVLITLKFDFMLRTLFKTICCVLLILPAMAQAQTDFVKTAIDETKRQYAPDSRTAIFAVEGELLNDSLCVLKGRCNNRQAVEALLHLSLIHI